MSEYDQFEEEEFTTQFNGQVMARMLGLVRENASAMTSVAGCSTTCRNCRSPTLTGRR
jgi:hypothetical protein